MDLDPILQRYLADNHVAEWLFAQHDLRQVNAQALDNAFVYTIGIKPPNNVRISMDIEDMLIVHAVTGTFVLGVVYGLARPHIFSETPFMAGQRPITRRFAVDLSVRDALEFMETNYFPDGKMAVVFRRFLHTNDRSLPVVVAATLHEACDIPYMLGSTIMRTDVFEAPTCPNCGRCGKRCVCSFDSYAPSGAITHTCHSWNQFTSMFQSKAQQGLVRIQITARLPNVGNVCISNTEVPVRTVVDRGYGKYVTLLKRKAVQGMGLDVVPIRLESPLVSKAVTNDFLDLHNHYIVRKRQRQPDVMDQLVPQFLVEQANIPLQDEIEILDLCEKQSPLASISPPEVLRFLENIEHEPSQDPGLHTVPFIHTSKEAPLIPNSSQPFMTTSTTHKTGRLFPDLPQAVPVTSLDDALYTSASVESQTDIVKDIESILKAQKAPSSTHVDAITSHCATSPEQQSSNSHTSASNVNNDETHRPVTKKSPRQSSKKARTTCSSLSTKSGASGDSDVSEKKHECLVCSARFKMRGDLLRHIRTVHEGKKRYQCPKCPKAFGHSGHLNRHIQSVHLQQRRFKCEICGFQFFQASHLQSHMGHVHNPNKPFECRDCGVRVSSKVALRSHRSKTKCGSTGKDTNKTPTSIISAPVANADLMTGGHNSGTQRLPMSV